MKPIASEACGFLDDELVVQGDPGLFPFSNSLLRGLGFFETLLWDSHKICEEYEHIERLKKSCGTFLRAPLVLEFVSKKVKFLTARAGIQGEAKVQITAWLSEKNQLQTWLTVSPYERPLQPLQIEISPFHPSHSRPLAGHKSISYGDYSIALREARSRGYDEALLFNTIGNLCEATTANVFVLKDEKWFTPSLETGCLPGIMRDLVIKRAEDAGIFGGFLCVSQSDFKNLEGMIFTNSLRRVHRVEKINGDLISVPPTDLLSPLLD